jgi:sugar/nucleoside kinase (ribokinase family)
MRRPGGQVATSMAACARLGLRSGYVGVFGDDANGHIVRQALQEHGVDVRHAIVRHGTGRYAVILVNEQSGDRVVLWDRGSDVMLRNSDITTSLVSQARVLHVDAVDEEVATHAARLARGAGVPVTCDIDRVTARTRDLLATVTVPILAEHVPGELTGETDLEGALRTLSLEIASLKRASLESAPSGMARRTLSDLWCVTRGNRGAMLLAGETLYTQPAFDVPVVDTTGAGDVFRAGFIVSLLRGDDPQTMLRVASAAAALSCTREGALGSGPGLDEVEALLRRG